MLHLLLCCVVLHSKYFAALLVVAMFVRNDQSTHFLFIRKCFKKQCRRQTEI